MKTSVVSCVVGLLLLVLTGDVIGAGISVNEVMPGCRAGLQNDHDDLFLKGFCLGVVGALFQRGRGICPPRESTVGQALRAVIRYIDSRPARLHESFYDLAAEALRTAWPCPAQ